MSSLFFTFFIFRAAETFQAFAYARVAHRLTTLFSLFRGLQPATIVTYY